MVDNSPSDEIETDNDRTEKQDRYTLQDFLGFEPESFDSAGNLRPEYAHRNKTRVGHWKYDDCDVYIGRCARNGSRHLNSTFVRDHGWLGNPYRIDDEDLSDLKLSCEDIIELYALDLEERVKGEPAFRKALLGLEGSVLGCWCRRLDEDEPRCHGDVIVETIERLAAEEEADDEERFI